MQPPTGAQAAPTLQVTTVVSGLSYPWDITWVGGLMLYDLRAGQVLEQAGQQRATPGRHLGLPSIYVNSEAGLLGMVADPAASTNRRFYTCQAVRTASGNPLDVRVPALAPDRAHTALSDGAPVVTGLPLTRGATRAAACASATDGKL